MWNFFFFVAVRGERGARSPDQMNATDALAEFRHIKRGLFFLALSVPPPFPFGHVHRICYAFQTDGRRPCQD